VLVGGGWLRSTFGHKTPAGYEEVNKIKKVA